MKHKLSQFITLFILVLILFVYINWQEENRWAGVFAETMNTTQDDLDKGYISIIVPHEEPVAAVKINIQGNDFESIDGYDLVLSDTLWKGIIGGIPVGQDREVEVSAYDLSENLIFTGTACLDIIGNHAATVIITLKSATLPETDPGKPVIENVVIFPDKVAPGDSINLDITAYTIDPDEQLNYHWDCPDGGMFEDPLSPVTYWISPGSNGIFQLRITVSDNEGNSDTLTFNVEVDEKYGTDSIPYEVQCFSSWNWHYYYAPRIRYIYADPVFVERGSSTNLGVCVYDRFYSDLNYHWYTRIPGSFDNPDQKNPVFTVSPHASTGWHKIKVIVSNKNYSALGIKWIKVIEASNIPPVINSINADPSVIYRGGTSALSVDAYDPDGDPLVYEWNSNAPGIFDDIHAANPVFIADNDAAYGKYIITVIVSDGTSNITQWVYLEIKPFNSSPVIESIAINPPGVYKGESAELRVIAADPESDALTYTWSTTCPGSFDDPTVANPVFTVDMTADYRAYPVIVIVSDGKTQVAGSVDITVKEKNSSPVIESITINPPGVYKGESAELRVIAADPEGDALTYTWSTACPGSFDDPT
ncbi:MAG: PKD domain-containing protein, partial [Spirochaetales bacterium]|nr:PKD domain-containing protein [Spirochaetales bacterium]